MNKLGLYIHIPFCKNKCLYCDFATMPYQDKRIDEYFKLLEKEISLYDDNYKDYIIDTIYIGGGTPSYVNHEYLKVLHKKIKEKFNIAQDLEFTVEANPNTINEYKLEEYLKLGINRISLGVQSFNNKILENIGRDYNTDIILKDIELIKKIGFSNVSLDLMMGLPDQEISDIYRDLNYIKEISPQHISYYDLIIEPNTRFNKLYKENKLNLPSENENREFYHHIINYLNNIGLEQYEISNFAKSGYKSRHNLKYWKLEEYLGFGLNASGYIKNIRYVNEYKYNDYKSRLNNLIKPIEQSEYIDNKNKLFERIIMNMRLTDGLSINDINKEFGINFLKKNYEIIKEYEKLGYLLIKDEKIIFTENGFNISNNFFTNLII